MKKLLLIVPLIALSACASKEGKSFYNGVRIKTSFQNDAIPVSHVDLLKDKTIKQG